MMPFGDNDWLALTQEDTLEPEIPICDPHHHMWDRRPARIPYQKYMLDELYADLNSGHNVRSTVFIEAKAMYRIDGPDEMKPVGEVEFVQGLAAASATGLYGPGRAAAAIVGHADLNLGDGVKPVLEALQAASPNRFRGVRHTVTWDSNPDVENTPAHKIKGQMSSISFRAGAKVLAGMGHSLEGWMFFTQLEELAEFAKAVPDLTIILCHVGGLLGTGPYAGRIEEVRATWIKGIAAAAAQPNVVMKLGGVGQPRYGFDWHTRETPIGSEELADSLAPLINHCIDQFGPTRCMFESNFPVDNVSYSYNVMYNAFKRITKDHSASERADMFHDVAAKVYRVDV